MLTSAQVPPAKSQFDLCFSRLVGLGTVSPSMCNSIASMAIASVTSNVSPAEKKFRQIGHRRAAIRVRIFVSLGGKDHGYSFQSTRLKTDFNVLVGTSLLGCVVITNLDCTECLKLFFFVGRCPNEFVQGLRLQTVSAHDGGR